MSDKIEYRQIDYGIDIKNRIIFLDDEIGIREPTDLTVKLNMVCDKNIKDPITLQITSFGGDVYAMLGILDVIQNAPVPIYTFGVGAVMSAASFILAAGKKGNRSIGKNTILMIHEMSTWFSGTTRDIVTEAKHVEELQKKLYSILADNSNKPASFWEGMSKTNLYLPAEQCLEYGLVDIIK